MRLSAPTSRALKTLKFDKPTRIQEIAVPQILSGHDVIGKAATGSGKTLAYGIPILEYFLDTRPPPSDIDPDEEKKKASKFIALVLSPTRELAKQISTHIEELSTAAAADMRVVTLTGGLSLQKQLRVLEHAHVIVATPGRLWEVMTEGAGWVDRFKDAHFLVVDEADRVLQEGHFEEVEKVLKVLNEDVQEDSDNEEEEREREAEAKDDDGKAIEELNYGKSVKIKRRKLGITRQTLVFSATFHKGLQMKLAGKANKKGWNDSGDLMEEKESMAWLLKRLQFREEKPRWIDIESSKGMMAEGLKEGIVECGAMEKDLYLYYLLLRYPSRTLIFTNSISSVKRLSPLLNLLMPGKASPLHSTMPQKSRLRYLERFSDPSNKNQILIATDVAARGLDIKGVEMVIHYHVPRTADMYVHRSGRTARAGDKGISVILCSPEELIGVHRLVGKVHADSKGSKGHTSLKSFDVDRSLTSRLKRRVELAKKITDAEVSTKKQGAEENWIQKAAEELGVDYDSDDFEKSGMGRGKGKGKDKKGRGDKVIGKQQVAEWKAMLREELASKVNAGFSTKYLTSGTVNVAQMLTKGVGLDGFMGLEEKAAIDEINE